MIHPRDRYPRTVCACKNCGAPCRSMPGMLAPGDIGRIAALLEADPDAILKTHFRASPGAKVAKATVWGVRFFHIGTIVPASDDTGACVFLQANGLCQIHPVAPYGCSHFDWHMDRATADPRSFACLQEIMRDIEYQRKWHVLNSHGLTTEGPEAKRARLKEREGIA
jgi:Fe-S-cluster containining protein